MRPWKVVPSYSIRISVKEWMGGSEEPTKNLLLSYLIDTSSSLDMRGSCTAAVLEQEAALLFTFTVDTDRQSFQVMLEEIWQEHWVVSGQDSSPN